MLTLELYTPSDDPRPIFITGNFNGWVTKDERFRMEKVRDGHYRYAFGDVPEVPTFEYKYVKGGWEGEELDRDGFPPENRRMDAPKGKVMDIVPRWKAHSQGYDPAYYPDIRVVGKKFSIPQLNRRRRVSVLLPWNYERQPNRRYPVLYLQDGQNLFESGAPFGTWGVDKRLAALAQKGSGDFIVVAIDHGGKERIREFNPYDSAQWGEGLGREYARFLAETLKPYIDKNFRTLSDRAHTAIGGSSMGGLISIYAGVMFPQVYSRFMIFSPSLWVSQRIYMEPLKFHHLSPTKIYFYAGGKESRTMESGARRFKDIIEARGFSPGTVHFRLEIDPDGLHNEERWGIEFPKAAEWLFS